MLSLDLIKAAKQNEGQNFALVSAVSRGNVDHARECLLAGADIHYDDDKALRLAAHNGNWVVLDFLLQNGANVRANNDECLLCAARRHDEKMVEFLARQGGNIPEMVRLNGGQMDFGAAEIVDRVRSRLAKEAFQENMAAINKVIAGKKHRFVLKPKPLPPVLNQ